MLAETCIISATNLQCLIRFVCCVCVCVYVSVALIIRDHGGACNLRDYVLHFANLHLAIIAGSKE